MTAPPPKKKKRSFTRRPKLTPESRPRLYSLYNVPQKVPVLICWITRSKISLFQQILVNRIRKRFTFDWVIPKIKGGFFWYTVYKLVPFFGIFVNVLKPGYNTDVSPCRNGNNNCDKFHKLLLSIVTSLISTTGSPSGSPLFILSIFRYCCFTSFGK